MKLKALFLILAVLFLLGSSAYRVQAEGTLAETINNCQASGLVKPEDVHFNYVFKGSPSGYDAWTGATNEYFYLKTLAEIDGYSSASLDQKVKAGLSAMPMVGHMPSTYQGQWLVYDRYMVNAYDWAQQWGIETSKWDRAAAASEAVACYGKSGGAGLLAFDLGSGWSGTSRYYDEHAENVDLLNKLGATSAASTAWSDLNQGHWGGQIYGYTGTSGYECEQGSFAMITGNYLRSASPNVLLSLYNTMLVNGWNSDAWYGGEVGVMTHAGKMQERRLPNTLVGIAALHAYYRSADVGWRQKFISMLAEGQAWKGLTSTILYSGGQFSFFDGASTGGPLRYEDSATYCGMMLLFLYGIIPDTGSLSIPYTDWKYQDYASMFPATQFRFNYNTKTIRIPVNAGTLKFQFGSQTVSHNFGSSGIYNIQFSNDWNTILNVNGNGNNNQPKYGQVKVTATKTSQAVSFKAWIDSGTSVTVPASGYTFQSVLVGSHIVYASELDGSNQRSQPIMVVEGSNPPTTFDFSAPQPPPPNWWEQFLKWLGSLQFPVDTRMIFLVGFVAAVIVAVKLGSRKRTSSPRRRS